MSPESNQYFLLRQLTKFAFREEISTHKDPGLVTEVVKTLSDAKTDIITGSKKKILFGPKLKTWEAHRYRVNGVRESMRILYDNDVHQLNLPQEILNYAAENNMTPELVEEAVDFFKENSQEEYPELGIIRKQKQKKKK